jgi:hypothetical protein
MFYEWILAIGVDSKAKHVLASSCAELRIEIDHQYYPQDSLAGLAGIFIISLDLF